jgi:hypothetical protein
VTDDIPSVFAGVDPASSPRARFTISIPRLPSVFTGSGDLTAALLLAHSSALPRALATACERTMATVQAVCRRTMEYYSGVAAELEAVKAAVTAGGAGATIAPAHAALMAAAASSSGQMGGVIPCFNELRLVQSKADIEAPAVPPSLRAAALVL